VRRAEEEKVPSGDSSLEGVVSRNGGRRVRIQIAGRQRGLLYVRARLGEEFYPFRTSNVILQPFHFDLFRPFRIFRGSLKLHRMRK